MIQIFLAIAAGILTVGAPCILPILPILLGASVGHRSKTRPLMIVLGFILTFSLVGLLLSYLVTRLGLPVEALRTSAIILLALFGIFMVWPTPFEKLMTHMSGLINRAGQAGTRHGSGNLGGFILGCTLGVVWTPCAGPVLGSILTLTITQTNLVRAAVLLVAYALGAGIPMLIIAFGSQYVTTKVRALARYSRAVQQVFGVIIITLAVAMYFKYDLVLQAKLLQYYPGGTLKL